MVGGSHNFIAASFMRTVISAYRFVVSRLTCPSQPRITFHLDAGFEEMDGRCVPTIPHAE
jgi:hypothetical protein